MVSGAWTSVMELMESQAGTEVNHVNIKARRQVDGSVKTSGEKNFIACGEHDIAENMVHVAPARLPDLALVPLVSPPSWF